MQNFVLYQACILALHCLLFCLLSVAFQFIGDAAVQCCENQRETKTEQGQKTFCLLNYSQNC